MSEELEAEGSKLAIRDSAVTMRCTDKQRLRGLPTSMRSSAMRVALCGLAISYLVTQGSALRSLWQSSPSVSVDASSQTQPGELPSASDRAVTQAKLKTTSILYTPEAQNAREAAANASAAAAQLDTALTAAVVTAMRGSEPSTAQHSPAQPSRVLVLAAAIRNYDGLSWVQLPPSSPLGVTFSTKKKSTLAEPACPLSLHLWQSPPHPASHALALTCSLCPYAPVPLCPYPQAVMPQASTLVMSWPPRAPPGGSNISAATAAAAQQVTSRPPGTTSPAGAAPALSPCCALLAGIGFRSNLPVVVVQTSGLTLVQIRNDVDARLCTCGAPGEDYDGAASVKWRGSSSAVQMNKKSVGIALRSSPEVRASDSSSGNGTHGPGKQAKAGGKKRAAPFLGMPSADEWAMFGDDGDTTLGMRNALVYDLTRRMGRTAPRVQYAELFIVQDGQPLAPSHYWGVYLAMEKIEVAPGRVDIAAVNPRTASDLSGGYLLGFERSIWPSDVRVVPQALPAALSLSTGSTLLDDGRNLTFLMHAPNLKSVAAEQQGQGTATPAERRVLAWAASYLGSVQAALVNDTVPTLTQPSSSSSSQPYSVAALGPGAGGQGAWRALVDPGAFIDYLFSQEIPKNPDLGRGSVYMYKARGQPLVLGPPWDFNEAFGMCCGYPIEGYRTGGASNGSSGGSAISAQGWRFNICDEPQRCKSDPVDGISLWYRAVWNREPLFRIAVAQRWAELRNGNSSGAVAGGVGLLSDAWLLGRITSYHQSLTYAAPRNYLRWRSAISSPDFPTGQQQFDYHVRLMADWLRSRLAWMDSQLAAVKAAALTQLSPAAAAAVQQQLAVVGREVAPLAPETAAAVMAAAHEQWDEQVCYPIIIMSSSC
ncbi:hypothetical protein V8C86DRAFT_3029930 [Haematococcus lacustris]